MNRNSGNVSKTKKLISGPGNNSKPNRKSFQKASESSSISSNRNSSAQSEEDVRVGGVYVRPQVNKNASYEEQEQAMKKLQGQVKELKHKLRVLEESVDSKDYSLGTISREKDRAIGEVRRLERSNKQLRQQLSDERNHYLEEKEKFVEEMSKYKKRLRELKNPTEVKKINTPASRQSLINQPLRWQLNKEKGDYKEAKPNADVKKTKSQKLSGIKDEKSSLLGSFTCSEPQIRKAGSLESLHLYEGDDLTLQTAALRTENAKLRSIICERDERNYELCLRFLRMKHYKNDIRSRFQDLENEYLQVIANLMDKIDEARQEFNFIIDKKFKRPLHSTNAMYLQLVQRNSRMAFENASLRLENQCLKKELNKYINGVCDSDRKIDLLIPEEDSNTKLTMGNPRGDGTLKRIKKNVNLREIRTIYERELGFKNSDTDSNYMSKTSTTVPSNGSLNAPKSVESMTKSDNGIADKAQPYFQANSLPADILNKIFKRIDTSSCQTVDSGRSKDQNGSEIKIKDVTSVDGERKLSSSPEEIIYRQSQTSEKKRSKEDASRKLQKDLKPSIVEHKGPHKISDFSSMCESKESVVLERNQRLGQPPYSPPDIEEAENEVGRRQEKPEQRPLRHRLKSHLRATRYHDKDSGDGSSSLDAPFRRSDFLGRNQPWSYERTPQENQVREVFQGRNKCRRQIRDSCALEEKLEVSDLELPASMRVEGNTRDLVDLSKTDESARETAKENPRIDLRGSEDEGIGGRKAHRPDSGNLTLRSRSRSNNMLNLRDELMDATRNQLTTEPFWRRDNQCHSALPRRQPQTYRMEESIYCQELPSDKKEPSLINPELTEIQQEQDRVRPRRPESSRRFSHRLISTSPEQLRNILTESQLGTCYRMAPIIVGHATTEITSGFKYPSSNNEIVLQLVIPTSTMGQNPGGGGFTDREMTEKSTLEKETSISGLTPHCQKNLPVEMSTSDFRIPISSLQTSSSTMEMVDTGVANDRNNIMLRTLSAPGLLESSWLDPQTICETRDCSTNT